MDLERLDDAHGAHDTRHDEGRRAEQLADGEAARVRAHRGERREDVRAAVPEREEGDAGDVLVEPEQLGDGGEVGGEEVGGADAEGGEEEDEPDDEGDEGDGAEGERCAEVAAEVVDAEECPRGGALLLDVGALLGRREGQRPALRGARSDQRAIYTLGMHTCFSRWPDTRAGLDNSEYIRFTRLLPSWLGSANWA